jgi:hypothetical protein
MKMRQAIECILILILDYALQVIDSYRIQDFNSKGVRIIVAKNPATK